MTVDTAHVLVDDTTTREAMYIAATRGRAGARLYVANESLIGIDAERPPAPSVSARDVLVEALHREAGERSATEVRRDAAAQDDQRRRAGERFVLDTVLRDRHIGTVTRALGPALAKEITRDDAFPALAKALAETEKTGRDPVEVLRKAAARRELDSAESAAKVLQYRVELMAAYANNTTGHDPRPKVPRSSPHERAPSVGATPRRGAHLG
jgi:hypothetical protein